MAVGAIAIFLIVGAVYLVIGIFKRKSDYDSGKIEDNKVK